MQPNELPLMPDVRRQMATEARSSLSRHIGAVIARVSISRVAGALIESYRMTLVALCARIRFSDEDRDRASILLPKNAGVILVEEAKLSGQMQLPELEMLDQAVQVFIARNDNVPFGGLEARDILAAASANLTGEMGAPELMSLEQVHDDFHVISGEPSGPSLALSFAIEQVTAATLLRWASDRPNDGALLLDVAFGAPEKDLNTEFVNFREKMKAAGRWSNQAEEELYRESGTSRSTAYKLRRDKSLKRRPDRDRMRAAMSRLST